METKLIFNRVYDCKSNIDMPVESKMNALVLGFRWILASFSRHRLSPACHSPVSRPRSSNRTCGFPASGSRTRFSLKACACHKQVGGTGDAQGIEDVAGGTSAFPATAHVVFVNLAWPSVIAFVAASGSCRALLDSSSIASIPCHSVRIPEPGPLPSTGVTRLHRYYEPLRHPPGPSTRSACWSRRTTTQLGFPCFPLLLAGMLSPTTPAKRVGHVVHFPARASLPPVQAGSAFASCISGPPRCSLALRPTSSRTARSCLLSPRLRPLRYLHDRWDSYPAGTTFAGAGLAPAGSTNLCTAHVD